MKIALISPYDFPYPGGVTEHIVALANGMKQRGHQVKVLAACSGYKGIVYPDTQAITRTVTTIPVGGAVARVGLSPLSYLKIRQILQQEWFDVIHLQEPLTPSITWLVLMQADLLPKTVTIGTFHAYHEKPNWFYRHGRPVFGRFFSKLNALIAVSKAAHQFAYQMFPGDYHIIPNGIDLGRFGKTIDNGQLAKTNSKTTILFVGRLDKRKGFPVLFQAFLKLKPNYPQLQLQVIGPFKANACMVYKKKVRAHNVTDIDFVGYVPPDRLPAYYRNANIFCAPSLGFESFGIVLLEAMAAGLPVVASDIAGYRSVLVDEQEGLLVPPGQVEPLVNALSRLLDNPEQQQKMGQQGYLKAGQYSWDYVVEKTLAVYKNTIQQTIKQPAITSSSAQIQRRHANHVQRSRTQI